MPQPIPKYNGVIAIVDMLGFGKFVELHSLDQVINTYAHILTSASFTKEVMKVDLEFMVYSDTIAIRLVNQSEEAFYNFIGALELIIHNYFYACQVPGHITMPIRGAISVGEYSWHIGDISTQILGRESINAKSINFIVGQPIIDAHKHEVAQDWIGISADKKTSIALKERFPNAINSLLQKRYLVESEIPMKNGNEVGYIVNPTERSTFDRSFNAFLKVCDSIFKDKLERKDVKMKFYNTLVFLKQLHSKDQLYPYFSKEISLEIGYPKINETMYKEVVDYYNTTVNKQNNL